MWQIVKDFNCGALSALKKIASVTHATDIDTHMHTQRSCYSYRSFEYLAVVLRNLSGDVPHAACGEMNQASTRFGFERGSA